MFRRFSSSRRALSVLLLQKKLSFEDVKTISHQPTKPRRTNRRKLSWIVDEDNFVSYLCSLTTTQPLILGTSFLAMFIQGEHLPGPIWVFMNAPV
jgi:hypothetical protein